MRFCSYGVHLLSQFQSLPPSSKMHSPLPPHAYPGFRFRCYGCVCVCVPVRGKCRRCVARWGLMLRRCVSGSPHFMRHSSVRLDSGDSLARARTKSASVSAHAHRTPCRIRGCLRTLRVRLRRIYPPKASLSAAHFASLSTHRRASHHARLGSSR